MDTYIMETYINDILTQLGEAPEDEDTAWVELPNGRSIEVMINKLGKAWYAARLHCSSNEYDGDKFRKTLGVIEQYCTPDLSTGGLRMAVKHLLYCNDVTK